MILQNNNFSVLPFYSDPDERNSEKWYVYGHKYPLYMMQNNCLPFQIVDETGTISAADAIIEIDIYTPDGTLVRSCGWTHHGGDIQNYVKVKEFTDISVIVCTGGDWLVWELVSGNWAAVGLPNGTYYFKVTEQQSSKTWYSDYFVYVNDPEPYLCIEWYDNSDFLMDSGVIVYTNPTFHNKLYLATDLAKPTYEFEEEGENRDGFFFPTKQVSQKRFQFSFLAPEYLLDVLRFVRMSENIIVRYHGASYNVDNILFTPNWESWGDLASVVCEFTTATVAKKIGMAYVR